MHQTKKKGISDGPVADRIVIGGCLNIAIGIDEEIGEGVGPFEEDPGKQHSGNEEEEVLPVCFDHGYDRMKFKVAGKNRKKVGRAARVVVIHFNGLLANRSY